MLQQQPTSDFFFFCAWEDELISGHVAKNSKVLLCF